MIWRSGGGFWNTLQCAIDDLDEYVDVVEELKIIIDNKDKEIFFMEKKQQNYQQTMNTKMKLFMLK